MTKEIPNYSDRDTAPDLSGQVRRLTSESIGCGAFCEVFKGEWTRPDGEKRMVAAKVLRGLHIDEEKAKILERLDRECHVWRGLNHPNVLRFYGIDHKFSHTLALISPYCDNKDVSQYIKYNRNADRIKLLVGVAAGLKYLHEKKVVHGDIKSNNIVVSDNGTSLLCDFGKARIVDHKGYTTRITEVFPYLAPELMVDDKPKVTYETDVFAFSIVGVEILRGKNAYGNMNPFKLPREVPNGLRPKQDECLSEGKNARIWPILVDCWCHEPNKRLKMGSVVERLAIVS
ncbi:hypothetical protein AX17_004899 [Amanita inopinata Kibby_2008]|nr:hypothetical protein AX17_004899 [Amanita inopinata Kibby_2008]